MIDEELEEARRTAEASTVSTSYDPGAVQGDTPEEHAERRRQQESNNRSAYESAWNRYRRLQETAPARKLGATALALETARLDCWKTIAGRLPEVYSGSPQSVDLIQFRIMAPDAARKKPRGEFVVANSSGRTLTNVTLVLDLLHFSTAPDPSTFQAYLIPEWQAGEELRLPVFVWRNYESGEAGKSRPINADPLHTREKGDLLTAESEWRAGLGGLVAVRASVWSAEAHHPARDFPFPDQALAGARWELGVALRLASNQLSLEVRKGVRKSELKLPDDFWEVRTAKRVLTFVAPDSELARLAHLLIDDPVQLLQERNPEIETVASRLATGTVFQGKWTFRMPYGPPMRYGQLTQDRLGKLAVLTHKSFPCTLEINAFNPRSLGVTATLQAVNQPGVKRVFRGQMMQERGTGRVFLYFPGPQAAGLNRRILLDTDFDLFTAPESLKLELTDKKIVGKMPGPLSPDAFWFDLECTLGGKSP